jgi:hypothetical protein
MEIKFKSIGVVHTKGTDAEIREKGNLDGELEIYPEFEEGLQGIDGYSHLLVLVYFDRLRPEQIGPLQVKPRVRRFSISKVTGRNIVPTTTSCQIGFALWPTTKVTSNISPPKRFRRTANFNFIFPQ